MTIEDLTQYGFREWPVTVGWNCARFWQYSVRDKTGHKFSVNVRLWNHPTHDGWDATCQLTDRQGHVFGVNLIDIRKMSADEVVIWFERFWNRNECQYYGVDDE